MVKTGYYSVNDLKKLLLPLILSEGDEVSTVHGDKIKIIGSNTITEVLKSFEDNMITEEFSKYSPNSRVYFGIMLGDTYNSLSGVFIVHESDIIRR